MTPDVQRIVRTICSDFPETKNVKQSHNADEWFKIIFATNTLVIPPINYVKCNPIMIDKVAEAIINFSQAEPEAPEFDWNHLNLFGANTVEKQLEFIDKIHQLGVESEGPLFIAADIETRKVEWTDNKLLSIGFATDENTCYALWNIPHKDDVVHEALQGLFSDPNLRWIWHNGKFDCGRLKYLEDLDAHVDEDTMLKHYACINEKRGTHGLKDLGQLYLQAPAWDDELDRIKKDTCKKLNMSLSDFMYDWIPTEVLIPYMQRDCIATRRLYRVFNKLSREDSDFIYRKLCEASNVYMRVELAGFKLDMEYLEDLEYELEQEAAKANIHLNDVVSRIWDPLQYAADTKAKATLNTPFNAKSPKQLKWMLERVLNAPVPNTSAETLDELIDKVDAGVITSPDAKDFLEAIGAVRKNSKYMDTYISGFRDCACEDLRIRGTFNLHGTETGRLSSSNPNMQNIPRDKKIKNLLCAKEGCTLVQMDYSQAELRVLAMLSQDPWLINVYCEGKDLHDAVALDMFGPGFNKEQRVMAKTINFGIAYGRGPGSIARTFKKSMSEAREIINKWYKPMPKVKAWIDNRRAMAIKGEPCTTLFGRERHFVISNENLNHVQNEYINTPIQSIASDFTMCSLMSIDKFLEDNNLRDVAQIVTTVHDSIILEVKDDPQLIKLIANTCVNIMAETPLQYVPACPVPFVADAEIGYKWGEMYKVDMNTGLAIPKEI